MTRWLLLLTWLLGGCASQNVRFVYDDVDSFAAAYAQLQRGTPAQDAMQQYVQRASPGLRLYLATHDVTAEELAAAVLARPTEYARVATLGPRLRRFERAIARGVANLKRISPSMVVPAIYFLVGSSRHGATPRELVADEADTLAVLVPIERLEPIEDIVQLTLHEVVHVAQAQTQGLASYRGIYRQPGRATNLAFAIREGCAEYLSVLAGGPLRERLVFGRKHERELWEELRPVLREEQRRHPGWFNGEHPRHPEWPSKIGYAVGMLMCEQYHRTAADASAALRDLLAADEDREFEAIAAPYERKFEPKEER